MTTLKKYDLKGQELGDVTVDDALAGFKVNGQVIKEYIIALRANARQWSASTKGRSDVHHSTFKPHRQKGTGRARQGMLSAPQYKGGGIVFGPKPKFDQHVRINRKERRAAVRHLIAEKIREERFLVLDSMFMEKPQTKQVAQFLKSRQLNRRVLFLGQGSFEEVTEGDQPQKITVKDKQHTPFIKSLRNIPKVAFSLVSRLNGYDVILANDIVITEDGLTELIEWLGNKNSSSSSSTKVAS